MRKLLLERKGGGGKKEREGKRSSKEKEFFHESRLRGRNKIKDESAESRHSPMHIIHTTFVRTEYFPYIPFRCHIGI